MVWAGPWSSSTLNARLFQMSRWIQSVMASPIAVWWLASRGNVHPFLHERLSRTLVVDKIRTAHTGAAYAIRSDEVAPAMEEGTGILPGLPAVAGKPVDVGFDGGRLTSDGGILLVAAIEQRLKIAERLAACLEDPRDPDRVRHELAEMIRYRALLIAAGYPDGNDCDALKADPAFKMRRRTIAGKR